MSEQACKLFEALLGVDAELLERSERGKKSKTALSGLKYGRAAAACLCVLLSGAAVWGGYRMAGGTGSGADENAAVQLADMAIPVESSEMEQTKERQSQTSADSAGSLQEEGIAQNSSAIAGTPMQEGWKSPKEDMDNGALTQDNASSDSVGAQGAVGASKEGKKESAANGVGVAGKEIPWEEACATEPFCRYLPSVLPAGYEPLTARRSAMPEQWNNMVFVWGDGERKLSLSMTWEEPLEVDEIRRRIESQDGLNQYAAEDFTKEALEAFVPESETVAFTLYYSDGMIIDFQGEINADEMWDLVSSVSG